MRARVNTRDGRPAGDGPREGKGSGESAGTGRKGQRRHARRALFAKPSAQWHSGCFQKNTAVGPGAVGGRERREQAFARCSVLI